MTRSLPFGLIALLLLTACAGREPNPVDVVQGGDASLSCAELRSEINVNSHAARGLMAEQRSKENKNLAVGAAGAILFPPALFFMDLKGASVDEARAYQRRNQGLHSRYQARACRPEIQIAPNDPAKPTPS